MKRIDEGQITVFDILEQLEKRVPPTVVWHYLPSGGTIGYCYCGKCGKFAGCSGHYSWRLTPEEAEEESKEVWCAIFGSANGVCFCGANMKGKGAVNKGFKNRYWWHEYINTVPFTKEQLDEIDKACSERYPATISKKIKKNGSTFTVEVSVERLGRDEAITSTADIEYYTNLWGETELFTTVDIDIRGNNKSKGHGSGYRLSELADEGANCFIAKRLGLKIADTVD